MKKRLLFGKCCFFSTFILLTNVGVAQLTQEWAARFNGSGNSTDGARSLAIDKHGNVYVTGTATGTGTGLDYRTIKYNAAGVLQWKALWNGAANGDDEAFSIAVDGNGNAYVTGRSIGNGTGFDFVTVKYNSAGVRQWSARYNGPGNGFDWAKAIRVDEDCNVYVTGGSVGNDNTSDYATIKYNKNGQKQWVARYDGPGNNEESNALVVDKDGNVYVTGRSPEGLDVDEQDMDYTTIKYNKKGQELWVRRYDGPFRGNFYDEALDITVDKSGNVYVTGRSAGSNLEDANDYATVKYNTNGTELWSARYNGPGNSIDDALSLAVDASQNVYVTGYSAAEPIETNYDYATIRYDANGQEVWVRRYNGPANDHDQAIALALDKDGNVYVTGRSTGIGTAFDFATIKYSGAGDEQSVARYNGPANGNDGPGGLFIGFYSSHPIAVDKKGNVYVTGLSTGVGTGFDITTIKYSQPCEPDAAIIAGRIGQPGNNTIPAGFQVAIAPNPAAITTKIFYELPVDGRVSIQVFDLLGRQITTLVDATKPAGFHNINFNVTTLQKGIYVYRITVRSGTTAWSQTGKISVIK
ncbi:SBBP repeat-containing protein [Longitalea luteola]|uniref:SBBP repeat-containing protein n=1 Tax=Longitalea luteola TaxID=2812563 RepID=UPI001A970BB1|nr:SBBP repeat-containing protein [Longitalea luteola]